jgi:hypothetical protein
VCKFVGTSIGADACSSLRKMLGSHALLASSGLGSPTFVCNATCAAEGDNTIMELKTVGDMVRGRTSMLPLMQLLRCAISHAAGRRAVAYYFARLAKAMWLQKHAMKDGGLLKDLAWARAHVLIIDKWLSSPSASTPFKAMALSESAAFLDAYQQVLMQMPVPLQF